MKKNKVTEENFESRLIDVNAPFAIREAFNMLRTNLMYTMTDSEQGCPIYAITSTIENTGKSTVIANLAISFANLSKKVLLIDGDLRCPTLYRFFGQEARQPGLSEVISGIETDVIVKDVRPNLDLITSGRIPPNPSELITSANFVHLLDAWKNEYDLIFIDFPPVGIVADSIAICKAITGYIFTIRSGISGAKSVNSAIESMERIGAKIIGVVLNDYDLKGGVGGYRRHGKYGKYGRYRRYSKYASSYENSYKASAKHHSADNATETDAKTE